MLTLVVYLTLANIALVYVTFKLHKDSKYWFNAYMDEVRKPFDKTMKEAIELIHQNSSQ